MITDQLEQALRTHRLAMPGQRIIVAVSGGADSMALLHGLCALAPAWKLALHVAHFDHGLREDSADDAAFVRSAAAARKAPITIERQDVRAACERHRWSLEDGARRLRHAFLAQTARKQRAAAIALAHTADDQAETVVMRLLRGSGLLGLGAMAWSRPAGEELVIIRPLLGLWRREIEAYCDAQRIAYRQDPSNRDRRFLRNRIRHELLPMLAREYNPHIKQALVQLADHAYWDHQQLRKTADRFWKRLAKSGQAGEVRIALAGLRRQPKALQRQLIRRAIQTVRGDLTRMDFRHWREAEQLLAGRPVGSIVDLPDGIQLIRQAQHLACRLAPEGHSALY